MENENFNHTDNKGLKPITENKPFITSIVIEIIHDDDPDLSYLTQSYDDEKNQIEREKYLNQDRDRLKAYYETSWYMIGIKAYCIVYIPIGNKSFMTQNITSRGLWGIESDSDIDYLVSIKKEQIDDLKQYLTLFNIDIPDNVTIETNDHTY